MLYRFSDVLPDDLNIQPLLISGTISSQFKGTAYLIAEQDGKVDYIYEIRYENHCSPFKDALITGNILAVGHEEFFYLFNVADKTNLLRLKMNGYFGHLYFYNQIFYVADACELLVLMNMVQLYGKEVASQ